MSCLEAMARGDGASLDAGCGSGSSPSRDCHDKESMQAERNTSIQTQSSLPAREAQRLMSEELRGTRPQHVKWSRDEDTKCPFSDWIIRVQREFSESNHIKKQRSEMFDESNNKTSDDKQESYFVHRLQIGAGERGSDFFFQMFKHEKSGSFSESEKGECCLHLSDLAADAFPALLDFVYYGQFDWSNHEIFVGLYSLSDYLRMDELANRTRKGILVKINMRTVAIFLEQATLLRQEKLCQIVVEYLGNNVKWLQEDCPVMNLLSEKQFLSIVCAHAKQRQEPISCHISKLVARFCSINGETISEGEFHELTDSSKIPRVSFEAAPLLYELAEQFNHDCLKSRCVAAMIQWYEQCQCPLSSYPDALAFLQRRGDVAVEVLGSTITALKRKTQLSARPSRQDPLARVEKKRRNSKCEGGT